MTDTFSPRPRLGLFEAWGVELEYMLVSDQTLDVRPICDQLLSAEAGHVTADVHRGAIDWSNELVLHVVELKTAAPTPHLQGLAAAFTAEVRHINRLLQPLNARLMPSAMHPWMDPVREMRLWPHDCSVVYEAFNRIFDCRGHGWANLQSVHLNLPFRDDQEFARLHAAVRLVLPLLPAIAAASPLCDGKLSPHLDHRLHVYRSNSRRFPSITGRVIPEQAWSESEYQERILQPMYDDIAPHDPDEVLQDEYLNARGAIARFGRGSIEIRVIDIQECPAADLAVLQAAAALIRALVEEHWCSLAVQQSVPVEPLAELFNVAVTNAEETNLSHPVLLQVYGFPSEPITLRRLWNQIDNRLQPDMEPEVRAAFNHILEHGPLARRIRRRLPDPLTPEALRNVAAELCDCLDRGRQLE
ncbi:MAG: glutamate-cysteine ligase family protein [Planctomycetaceae bacterium]